VFGLAGALTILGIVRWSRVKEDTAIGIVLSVFFGLGIVLLTIVQRQPSGNQSGLDRFLFGQAATLLRQDVEVLLVVSGIVLTLLVLLFKEIGILCFDREFAASLGMPVARLEILLTVLLVLVVVVGLQTVGVVLMVATLVTPAAAARQWTDRLGRMALLAGVLGGTAGGIGAVISAQVERMPTGPTIVLVSSVMLVASLLLAPRRGLLHAFRSSLLVRSRIRRENLLKDLYRLGERSASVTGPYPLPVVMGLRGQGRRELDRSIGPLERKGLLEVTEQGLRLTDEGIDQAKKVVKSHRLWEVYLTRRLELASDHVHRDAEMMEHALTDEQVEELDRLLGRPRVDPHGRIIPREVAS
jgi:manganese/zinc/iron transport system permease protein